MNRNVATEAIIVVTALAAAIFIWTAVRALWYSPEIDVEPKGNVGQIVAVDPADLPKRLMIPKIEANAAVQKVGINSEGNMSAPSNFTDVGWYRYGPAPGQVGSAVIDGHVDNGLKLAGVFKKLSEVSVGDDIYIETESGKRLHFVVTEIATYDYKDVPLERIFKRQDTERLNLITCEGDWIASDKTYDNRLVVYSELRR